MPKLRPPLVLSPFAFEPSALWRRYDTLRLYARILTPKPGTDLQGLLDGLFTEKQKLMRELIDLEQTIPGSLALSAGGCGRCGDNCTRPQGLPCRYPDQMRPCIDALGGDISKTMDLYFQKPLVWIKDGKTPDYLTLVGGLLWREDHP